MQIIIEQQEIEKAIENFISKSITLPKGSNYNVKLISGRGENGLRAVIDIGNSGSLSNEESLNREPVKNIEDTHESNDNYKAEEHNKSMDVQENLENNSPNENNQEDNAEENKAFSSLFD